MRSVLITFLCLLLLPPTVQADSYEIRFDTGSGGNWYGGDNRNPRSVGAGQSVLIDTSIQLTDFSFYLGLPFDYSENPEGVGHAVTLVLDVRDAQGVILKTLDLDLDASFAGGWVTWSGIDLAVNAGTVLIFTSYLVGATDDAQYWNSTRGDFAGGYPDGGRYGNSGSSDSDMVPWSNWSGPDPGVDYHFWLQGTTSVDTSEDNWGGVKADY